MSSFKMFMLQLEIAGFEKATEIPQLSLILSDNMDSEFNLSDSFNVSTTLIQDGGIQTMIIPNSIESISMIETEKLFIQVNRLLKDKSRCDAEIEALLQQQYADRVKIESLRLQLDDMSVENETMRQERRSEMTGHINLTANVVARD